MRIIIITLILLSSVQVSSGRTKYVKTRIDKEDFVETISIETQLNLMFAEVEIEGHKYKFLIDTGAPFSISPELAEKINFRLRGTDTMRSSNSKRGVQKWGIVKNIKIGSVGFSHITAFVIDFKKSEVLACLNFDGIIGSNLMNTCIWQIHHDEKKVIFTDMFSKLDYTSSSPQAIKRVGKQQAPYVVCKVNNGPETPVLFDTGSGDFFDLKYATYYNAKKAGKVNENIEIITGRGLGSSGIYGAVDTTKFMIKLPKLIIAGEQMEEVITDMSITSKTKIGIRFAKGRILTFDFPKNQLYIHALPSKHIEREFNTFGFVLFPQKEATIIGSIWEESSAAESELPKYAQVIKLNHLDFTTQTDNCELTFESGQILKETDFVDITVEVEGKKKEFRLEKRDLFHLVKEDEN